MSSDRTSEQYPTVAVCDECITLQNAAGENRQIVGNPDDYDPYYGDQCHFCDKSKEEEEAERS
jgi:hypothetical protein